MAGQWDGVTLRTTFKEHITARRDAVADAAHAGDWDTLLAALRTHPDLVNSWRLGGSSWFTPLHQAAWHNAPLEVARALLAHEPWLSLPDAAGDTPCDIALRNGNHALAELLTPVFRHPAPTQALRPHLHAVILERVAPEVAEHRLRLPEVSIIAEQRDPRIGFPIPGMYGGFTLRLDGDTLVSESWSRVVGGSGQRHVITAAGAELVESGFV
ncbi:ankyrin repeat domain-containing protein [Actinokineospora pegani]|uniref:ankyrin repeat domain-containing protein n=1 Tax=Actinokineospora pegani TaxID=2654637 RepID=UPI0012EA1F35|nr:ankyrin repeat domain-containing protein [Actinokineospora pegani]